MGDFLTKVMGFWHDKGLAECADFAEGRGSDPLAPGMTHAVSATCAELSPLRTPLRLNTTTMAISLRLTGKDEGASKRKKPIPEKQALRETPTASTVDATNASVGKHRKI